MSGEQAAAAAIENVQRELASLRDAERVLRAELATVQRQSARAIAMAEQEAAVESTMARLEVALDLAAVTRHVRETIGRLAMSGDRSSVLVIDGLLPAAAYQAALDAIPPAVFFDGGPGEHQLILPPRVAPTHVIATWMFLNDVAKDLVGPLLAEQLGAVTAQPHGALLKVSRSRLVSRVARTPSPFVDGDASPLFRMVVSLGPVRPNSAWVLPGGSSESALPLPDGSDAGWFEWHVSFTRDDKSGRSRRRHGDLDSWTTGRG